MNEQKLNEIIERLDRIEKVLGLKTYPWRNSDWQPCQPVDDAHATDGSWRFVPRTESVTYG